MTKEEFYNQLLSELNTSWNGLPDKPDESPQLTLNKLWKYVAEKSGVMNCDQDLPDLDAENRATLLELVRERISGVPLSYLVGKNCFMGIELLCGPEAMIPRKETEILGFTALKVLQELVEQRGSAFVMDLCTGSGNIPLALAYYEPRCVVWGSDLSEEAVRLARRNALYLKMDGRVQFLYGDLFLPFELPEFWGKFDLITCNPPYISSSQVNRMPHEIIGFEPRLAFDGGPFGVKIMTRLIKEAPRFLKPDSWLCFEVGLGQGEPLKRLVEKTGDYCEVRTQTDQNGEVRVILARTCEKVNNNNQEALRSF